MAEIMATATDVPAEVVAAAEVLGEVLATATRSSLKSRWQRGKLLPRLWQQRTLLPRLWP